MALVRGRDPYVGVAMALESGAWGTSGVEANMGWVGVPILSESLNIERSTLTETEEITPLGAREAFDTGSVIAVGDITVRPRWDSKWLNVLFGNLGFELYDSASWADGGNAASVYAHLYSMNQTLPKAFKLRVYKSGQTSGNLMATFNGCYVSTFTWNQPQDNHCTITFSILAKDMILAASTTPEAPQGTAISTIRDLGNTALADHDGVIRLRAGANWTAYGTTHGFPDIRSFSVTFNRGMEFEDAPINNVDQVSIPGNVNQRSVEVTIEGAYNETLHDDAEHPFNNYINNVESGFTAVYSNGSNFITGSIPYGAAIVIPRLTWTEAAIPIESGGTLVWTATGTGLKRGSEAYPPPQDDSTYMDGVYSSIQNDGYIVTAVGAGDDNNLGDGQGFTAHATGS